MPTYIYTYIHTYIHTYTQNPANPTHHYRQTYWLMSTNKCLHMYKPSCESLHSYINTTLHPYNPTLQLLPYPANLTLPCTYTPPSHVQWTSKVEHNCILKESLLWEQEVCCPPENLQNWEVVKTTTCMLLLHDSMHLRCPCNTASHRNISRRGRDTETAAHEQFVTSWACCVY